MSAIESVVFFLEKFSVYVCFVFFFFVVVVIVV